MKSPFKILITDIVHPLLIEGLRNDGFIVDFFPQISATTVSEIIDPYTGLIVNSKVYVGKEIMSRGQNLRFVCRAGSGLEVIDLDEARSRNIYAINAPEGNRNAVAEHALAMLLNMMNHISRADAEVRKLQWNREENRGEELTGKAVGMIAFGNTAQAFARLLKSFEVKVLAYDKYYHGFSRDHVIECEPERIFEVCDVLSLHLPLTNETKYMIDYRFLSSFKKPIWFINTSRGKVLRTSDLLRCLDEGKIKGAALDVLENEKLDTLTGEEKMIFQQLSQRRNVLLTPHIAGWTVESKIKIAETLLMKIRAITL